MTAPHRSFALPTRTDIERAIEQCGYPLEQAVVLAAERAKFHVMPNWMWRDNQDGKQREIDVVCIAGRYEVDATAVVHVLVECKTFRAGLVLFEHPNANAYDSHYADLSSWHFWGQPHALVHEPPSIGGTPTGAWAGWTQRRWKRAPVWGTQYEVVQGKPPHWTLSQEGAHESVESLRRCFLAYQRDEQIAEDSARVYMNFGALVVAVDGPLYASGARSMRRRPRLKSVRCATFVRHAFIGHYPASLRVDFVQAKFVPRYLVQLRKEIDEITSEAVAQKDLLRESVKKFGSSRKYRSALENQFQR
ncbi:MAG: hypothetical protein HY898_27930 [Deltaproteobacteria bacterium]|nr:hypothetical protein [Deltaproteobacteria bacterium]